MHIFLHKRINYGHVTHAAIFVYNRTAETAPEAVRLVRQKLLKRVCV